MILWGFCLGVGYNLTDSGDWPAVSESVAGEPFATQARRGMVDYTTLGVGAASARTRIDTFTVDAGLFGWAVRANHALWSAIGNRTDHSSKAGALRDTAHRLTLGIRAARWRVARIWRNGP
jgi:hypothetical protein